MRNKIILIATFLISLLSFGQGKSYGINYGQGIDESSKFSVGIDFNYYYELNDDLYLGLTINANMRQVDAIEDFPDLEDATQNLIYTDLGLASRYYLSDLFKINLDTGYSLPLSANNISDDDIKGSLFIKPYLELDFDSISIIAGPHLYFGGTYNFTSINLGIRFKDLY
jgi:hypothetical protein